MVPLDSPLSAAPPRRRGRGAEVNRLEAADRPAHDWYRFILSYPPHLVRDYVQSFDLGGDACVLDPFCGTGTTPVECKKLGLRSVGVEAHPLVHFAGSTKLDWSIDGDRLDETADAVATVALEHLASLGIIDDPAPHLIHESPAPPLRSLPEEAFELLLTNSISPAPLHKTLVLLEAIDAAPYARSHLRLALAKALVHEISNLQFGPEVGVGPVKEDAPVISTWRRLVGQMASDLRLLHPRAATPSIVHRADSRQLSRLLAPKSIDAVITSPPYPNEKDYTRTTRLETVVLGFIQKKSALRDLKRTMLRSNTRGVYISDTDDQLVAGHQEIQRIAGEIEARRIELGKTSGFEKLYARVTRLYFGGMARHLAELRPLLRPGALLAYVVGDQASYLRVIECPPDDDQSAGRYSRSDREVCSNG